MKLKILTACHGQDWEPLRRLVEPIFREYADRHGYIFDMLLTPYKNASWHFPVQKTAWVRDVLEESDCDYFWVVDIDILLTHLTIPVERFLDDKHHIFMARDVSGNLNCGSYLLKNSTESKKWLDTILPMREHTTSEQHAIIIMSEEPQWFEITKELSHPSINSTRWELYPAIGECDHIEGQWLQGDLCCHLMGMTPMARYDAFKEMLPLIIR